MLFKLNKIFLFALLALFGFSIYRLFFIDEFYPYAFVLFATLLSIGIYFSLLNTKNTKNNLYIILSFLGLLNCVLLVSDYFYPEQLRSTWNYSLAVLFLLLFLALISRIKQIKGLFATIVLVISILSGLLIEIALLFKISNQTFYQSIVYSLIATSIAIIVLFATNFKRKIS